MGEPGPGPFARDYSLQSDIGLFRVTLLEFDQRTSDHDLDRSESGAATFGQVYQCLGCLTYVADLVRRERQHTRRPRPFVHRRPPADANCSNA